MKITKIRENFSARVDLSLDEVNIVDWPTLLYQHGVLVVNFSQTPTWDEIWNFNSKFGQPWNNLEYMKNLEGFFSISDNKFLTHFTNKINQKRYPNMADEIGWHRDCHWYDGCRFPIRSLYSLSIPKTDKPGVGHTIFCYDKNLFDLLTEEEKQFYLNCTIEVQMVYDKNYPRQIRPLVKKHFYTNKYQFELNSFLAYNETPSDEETFYGATSLSQGPFITKLLHNNQQVSTSYLTNLFLKLREDKQNYYIHQWKENQLLIWDNTAVLHRRSDIGPIRDQLRAFIRMNMKHFADPNLI